MGGQLAEQEVAGWYAGKSFSADWTLGTSALGPSCCPFRDAPVRVLEIGSWEGRSALFFLNYFARSHVVCVDTFGGNIEHMRNPHFCGARRRYRAPLRRECRGLRGASGEDQRVIFLLHKAYQFAIAKL
jgi:hypothetical protein